MEKNPPLSKIYEALSAVADQRIDIQADRAYVLSSDHAKRYTVKFLENGYSLSLIHILSLFRPLRIWTCRTMKWVCRRC